jgi:hypothetical protein
LIDFRNQNPGSSEQRKDIDVAVDAEVANGPEVVHFQDYDSTKPLTFLMAEDGLVIVETGNFHQNQVVVGGQEHYQVSISSTFYVQLLRARSPKT